MFGSLLFFSKYRNNSFTLLVFVPAKTYIGEEGFGVEEATKVEIYETTQMNHDAEEDAMVSFTVGVGDTIDVRTKWNFNEWYSATVMAVNSYNGILLQSRGSEWLMTSSTRLAPHGSMTPPLPVLAKIGVVMASETEKEEQVAVSDAKTTILDGTSAGHVGAPEPPKRPIGPLCAVLNCKLSAQRIGSIVCDEHQYKPPTRDRCHPSIPCRMTTENDTVHNSYYLLCNR
jgi:hypothetical protein